MINKFKNLLSSTHLVYSSIILMGVLVVGGVVAYSKATQPQMIEGDRINASEVYGISTEAISIDSGTEFPEPTATSTIKGAQASKATPTPTPTPSAVPTPVTNNTNYNYQVPTTFPTTSVPVDYSEALKQAQAESDKIHAEYVACMNEKNNLIQPLIVQRDQKQSQYNQNMDQCVNAVPGKESIRYISCYEDYSNLREEINNIQSQINSISNQYGCY